MTDAKLPTQEGKLCGPAFENTDDAEPHKVLAAVLHCALSWEGGVRIIGNVRAVDIVRALEAVQSDLALARENAKGEALRLESIRKERDEAMEKFDASIEGTPYLEARAEAEQLRADNSSMSSAIGELRFALHAAQSDLAKVTAERAVPIKDFLEVYDAAHVVIDKIRLHDDHAEYEGSMNAVLYFGAIATRLRWKHDDKVPDPSGTPTAGDYGLLIPEGAVYDADPALLDALEAAQVGCCDGCGSTQTVEQIRREHPKALSCCPERKMLTASQWRDRAMAAQSDLAKAAAERDHARFLADYAGKLTEKAEMALSASLERERVLREALTSFTRTSDFRELSVACWHADYRRARAALATKGASND